MFCLDPTRITQGPVDMEIIVGESIVLPCQIACDASLDVSFSWAFNGQLLNKLDPHYEHVGGVSEKAFEWAIDFVHSGVSDSLRFFENNFKQH